MMKKNLLVLIFTLISIFVSAQEVQVDLEKGFELESIETKGDIGFVCVLKTKNPNNKENDLKYKFFNANMELVKTESFHHEKYTMEWETFETDEYDHQIYAVRSGKLLIRSIGKKSLDLINVEIVLPEGAGVIEIDNQGDYVWCVMYKGAERGVFKMNWRTGESEFFPFKLEGVERMKFVGLKVIPSEDLIVLARQELKDEFVIHAVHMTPKGEQAETTVIADKKLLTTNMLGMGDGHVLFAGAYSSGSQYKSEGIVLTTASNGEVMNKEIVTYSSIPEFSLLSGKGEKKGHYVGNIDIVKTKTGSMVIGEVAYPVNHSGANGQLIFDYYKFTHGFICVLDEEGKVTWSATFKDGFTHFSLDISKSHFTIEEEDAETFILKNYKSGRTHEINLTDNVITTTDKEKVTSAKKPRFEFDPAQYDGFKMWSKDALLVYKKEKIKTDEGKKTVLVVAKISR